MTSEEAKKEIPENCPQCRAKRIGIQEGLAFYACGTIYRIDKLSIEQRGERCIGEKLV